MVCIPSQDLREFAKVPEYALVADPEYLWIRDFQPRNLTFGSDLLEVIP